MTQRNKLGIEGAEKLFRDAINFKPQHPSASSQTGSEKSTSNLIILAKKAQIIMGKILKTSGCQ
ncbi:MAG: hypothetical protein HWD59_09505 [Coxiellaceae bacterium]|nr:MAG: hypothetical protein HWD59_09505 [Coxiellaceae bacterium]